jgi:hypothetical protein
VHHKPKAVAEQEHQSRHIARPRRGHRDQ